MISVYRSQVADEWFPFYTTSLHVRDKYYIFYSTTFILQL